MKNIVVRRTYEKNGEEKVSWDNIGILIEKDGKQYIKLNSIPLNRDWFASVFEQEKKEDKESDRPF